MSTPRDPSAPTAPPEGGITVSGPAVRAARGPQADPQRIPFPGPVVGDREAASGGLESAGGRESAGGAPARRRVAVLVCHGMGQQVPFENIDLIAGALERAGAGERGASGGVSGAAERTPRVRFARLGKQWLPRAEVALETGERPTDVHVYEAYWAPLTEGRVKAFDVTRFLLSAGFRGLQYALRGRFDRWIFGGPKEFRLPPTTILSLVAAFAVVVSALVLYAALGTLVVLKLLGLFAADGMIAEEARRLSAGLGTGLLRSPLLLSLFLVPAAAVIWAGRVLGRVLPGPAPAERESLGMKIAAAAAAGCGVAALFAHGPTGKRAAALMEIVLPGAVDRFGGAAWAWLGVAGAAVAAVLALSIPLAVLCRKASAKPWLSGASLAAALLLAGWMVDAAYGLAAAARAAFGDGAAPADPSLALGRGLFVLFAASAVWLCYLLRGLYIQYLGDVAVYLSSHTLNAFDELRAQIRRKGYEAGCAIYGARNETDTGWEYEEVLVAGHSLGSVVAYDTLNAVLNEDRALGGEIDAERRTRALVTFGSPLDKSAFIFRTQMEDSRYREALAAAVQPLVEPVPTADGDGGPLVRTIPWRNIHSPFDPISGPVNYYDPPDRSSWPEEHEGVENLPDPRACVFGAAHVAYWRNPLLVGYLHEQLTTARKPA